MDLRFFVGKNVKLTDDEDREYKGYVSDYIFAEDNVPEEVEAIVLDYLVRDDGFKYKNLIEFTAPEIKSIEVIE